MTTRKSLFLSSNTQDFIEVRRHMVPEVPTEAIPEL